MIERSAKDLSRGVPEVLEEVSRSRSARPACGIVTDNAIEQR